MIVDYTNMAASAISEISSEAGSALPLFGAVLAIFVGLQAVKRFVHSILSGDGDSFGYGIPDPGECKACGEFIGDRPRDECPYCGEDDPLGDPGDFV